MILDKHDENYLASMIESGKAILVLGAGASVTSTNRNRTPVKTGLQLANIIANAAALPYDGETLTDVINAVRSQYLSDAQIMQILTNEYSGVTPSPELARLFRFVWKRAYTFNIDDAIERCPTTNVQMRRYYNGLIDKAAEFGPLTELDIIHLHGEIAKPEHKFILTEADYAEHIKSSKHYWYQRLAQDYLSHCPIFVGSTLNEPILVAEIERAKRDANSVAGKAFLLSPDQLSSIRVGSLRGKGIVHIRAPLSEFSAWLERRFPNGITSESIIARTTHYPQDILTALTRSDLDIASHIRQIELSALSITLNKKTDDQLSLLARQFLRGFPPNWNIATSNIPVELDGSKAIYATMSQAISQNERLFVITGQSGSGKTTAAMMCLLKYIREHPGVRLFDIDGDVRSIGSAFRLLKKLSVGPCVVYVGDLFVFGDSFRADLENLSGQQVTVVSTARSGEWTDRLARYLGDITCPSVFSRFSRNNFDHLIDRLLKFVPSPSFRKLSSDQRRQALARSKSQLLIALREATDSDNFTDIITNEFERLPDADTKALFFIVGLATLARVGISQEMAKEAYETEATGRTYSEALGALEGIVAPIDSNGRLLGRHELYVRHVFENVASFHEFYTAMHSVLKTFTKFEIPIVKSVRRLDAQLFRFLPSHNFILDHAIRHNEKLEGKQIYRDFEIDFQLDGHFWLQYGLYEANIGQLDDAILMLRRSIQAYPDNPYSVHALADIQLRSAKERNIFDTLTRSLIDDAVRSLRSLDAKTELEMDEYPIVTLAIGHVAALLAHKQTDMAVDFAKQYYDRLQQIEKITNSQGIIRTRDRMFRFVTTREFYDKPVQELRKQGRQHRSRKPRR